MGIIACKKSGGCKLNLSGHKLLLKCTSSSPPQVKSFSMEIYLPALVATMAVRIGSWDRFRSRSRRLSLESGRCGSSR